MIEVIIERERKYIANTYKRFNVAFIKGEGVFLYDINGKRYLDFLSGIATVNLGHSNEYIINKVCDQIKKIVHTSNLFYIIPQIELAEILYKISNGYKSFFCNSGAEAVESAIKLARKATKKREIISAYNSFHGRTLGALSATGQEKYKKPFEPLVPGFKHVMFNDVDDLRRKISKDTAAVILEPIQGEGGVIVPDYDYLREVKEICEEYNALLILDEVQTGMGRLGEFFAYMYYKVEPDIFCLAKALANGFPIGAMLAKPEIMDKFEPGDHASTFGGNFLSCVAAKATIEYIIKNNVLDNVKRISKYLFKKLEEIKGYEIVKEIRGVGLMIGIELKRNICRKVAERCLEKGLVVGISHENVLRLLPPLIIKEEHVDHAINILKEVLEEFSDKV